MRCFRTVDAREARAVNGEYMGAFQHMTCTSFTNPSTIPIGRIAMDIYNASSPGVLSQDVAQYLWNKGREDDNPTFNSDAIFNPSLDVTIVSWARIECRNPDYMFQPNWFVWCIRFHGICLHQKVSCISCPEVRRTKSRWLYRCGRRIWRSYWDVRME